jgi:hypothetical protein
MNTDIKQRLYYRGPKEQISESDSKQLLEEKIIWSWTSPTEIHLMCKNCGARWWVQNITDDKIPIEYLRCMDCQNINYDVCRLSRQLEEKNKALEEKDKALFNAAEIMLKSGINIEIIMRATRLIKEEITTLSKLKS